MLRFADFELDVAQQELRRSGDIVHMEPQVFNLLLHLVRNRGRIVSKDELIETVWNGRIVSEAALSSRINAARKAIGDNGNDQLFIRTLHKRGFRFVGAVIDGAPSIVGPSKAEAESGPRRDAAEPVDATPGASGPSIAVLPFDNFGGNAEGGRIFAPSCTGGRTLKEQKGEPIWLTGSAEVRLASSSTDQGWPGSVSALITPERA